MIIWNSQKTTSPSASPSIFGPFRVFTNRPHTLPQRLARVEDVAASSVSVNYSLVTITFGPHYACERLVVKIIQVCLRTGLAAVNGSGLPFIERLLLAIIFHCSRDADHDKAMRDLRETCSCM